MKDNRPIICKQCGAEKNTTPQTRDAKFCDRVCYGLWTSEHYEERAKPAPRVKMTKEETKQRHLNNLVQPTGNFPMFV